MMSKGNLNEDAGQGMIDDMSNGKTGRMSLRLKPGQHTAFTVRKS